MTLAAAFVGSALLGLFKICEYDVWWHLALGRRIVEQGLIGGLDPFTYTLADRPYPHSDWLFDLLLYLIQTLVGLEFLPAITALLVGLLGAGICAWCMQRGLGRAAALWLALLAIGIVRYRLFLRPDLASLLLFGLELALLEAARQRPRLLFLLPPLLLVWSNLHDGVIFGLILAGLYLAADLLQPLVERRRLERLPWRPGLALAIGFGLTFVNPAPGQYLGHVFGSALPNLGPYPESGPLTAAGHYLLLFAFVLSAALLCLRLGRQPLLPLLLLASFAAFSIRHGRLGAFFGLLLPAALAPLLPRAGELSRRASIVLWSAAWAALLTLGGLDLYAGRSLFQFGLGVAEQRLPVHAVEFLRKRAPQSELRLYNSYEFGGYIEWALPGRAKVFWDGRTRFSLDFVYSALSADPAELLAELRPDAALIALPRGDNASWVALDAYILNDPEWVPLYFDDAAVVLTPLRGPLSGLIPELGYGALEPQSRSLDYLRPLLAAPEGRAAVRRELERAVADSPENSIARLAQAQVLLIEGDLPAALALAQRIVVDRPDFYEAREVLGRLLLQDDRPEQALRHFARAARLAPDSAAAHNNLGVADLQTGRLRAARREFQRALEIDPRLDSALYNLALIAESEGRPDEAELYRRRMQRPEPDGGG